MEVATMPAEELLRSIAKQTEESEYYTPIPEGYSPGKTKYIIITATTMRMTADIIMTKGMLASDFLVSAI